MYFAYIRVSTEDQNLERQLLEMVQYQKNNNIHDDDFEIIEEKASGKNIADRPAFLSLLTQLRKSDTIIFSELSRLGRNYDEIVATVNEIKAKKAKMIILDAPFLNLDTGNDTLDSAMSDMFLSLLAYIADSERKKMLERQKAGIAVAKAKGRYKGSEVKYGPNSIGTNKLIYETVINGLNEKDTISAIAARAGIPRKTVYEIKKRYENGDTD